MRDKNNIRVLILQELLSQKYMNILLESILDVAQRALKISEDISMFMRATDKLSNFNRIMSKIIGTTEQAVQIQAAERQALQEYFKDVIGATRTAKLFTTAGAAVSFDKAAARTALRDALKEINPTEAAKLSDAFLDDCLASPNHLSQLFKQYGDEAKTAAREATKGGARTAIQNYLANDTWVTEQANLFLQEYKGRRGQTIPRDKIVNYSIEKIKTVAPSEIAAFEKAAAEEGTTISALLAPEIEKIVNKIQKDPKFAEAVSTPGLTRRIAEGWYSNLPDSAKKGISVAGLALLGWLIFTIYSKISGGARGGGKAAGKNAPGGEQ